MVVVVVVGILYHVYLFLWWSTHLSLSLYEDAYFL